MSLVCCYTVQILCHVKCPIFTVDLVNDSSLADKNLHTRLQWKETFLDDFFSTYFINLSTILKSVSAESSGVFVTSCNILEEKNAIHAAYCLLAFFDSSYNEVSANVTGLWHTLRLQWFILKAVFSILWSIV